MKSRRISFAGTSAAYYCYLVGLSRVNVTRGSYLFFTKPFMALAFALIYLNEGSFSLTEWIGFAMIIAGLVVVMFFPLLTRLVSKGKNNE